MPLFLTLLLFSISLASAELTIASGTRFAALQIGILDSLQINDARPNNKINDNQNQNDYLQNSLRIQLNLWGNIAPALFFNAHAEVTTDNGNREILGHDYEPFRGYPYDPLKDDNGIIKGRTWDFFAAKTEWKPAEYFNISAGFDYLEWGPAKRNKLTLRGDNFFWRPFQDTTSRLSRPVPTPFVSFEINLDFITYSQHIATLKNWKDQNKFLHAHRLNFTPTENFSLGLTETIIYGGAPADQNADRPTPENRSVETVYLIPFVPYLFAQHYGGDRDNAAMSADFSWKIFRNYELYGELFLDDLNTLTSFFDDSWWGNKWASTIGISATPRKIGALLYDYRFEFTRIEPWVYTHHKGAGNDYSHFGQSLGSDLGPNAREFFTNFGLTHKTLRLDLSLSSVAKDTAFGGNLTDIHTENDPTDKKFLNPATTIYYRDYSVALKWQPFRVWHIRIGQNFIFGDYKGKRTEISSGILW